MRTVRASSRSPPKPVTRSPASSRSAALRQVANFRFDDPGGQVGIETLLVRAGDGQVMQLREPTARVVGSGAEKAPDPGGYSVEVVRVPGSAAMSADALVLTGTWTGHREPTVLAFARMR